jgi:hypothetical protein
MAAVESNQLMADGLRIRMSRTSLRDLRGTLDPSAALRDVGNGDRKMSANRNLSEQRFHRTDF